MNRLFFILSICLLAGTARSVPPVDIATIKSSLNTRITNNGHTLQKAILDELVTQRKAADKQEQIEMRQAQKLLQEECDTHKKARQATCTERKNKLYDQYVQEKKRRKELHAQVTKSLSTAKRAATGPAKTLGLLLDQAASYLDVLHTHADTAELTQLARQAHTEQEWLRSLKDKIERSSIDLSTPLKK